jgi:prepilin signal peptidase PulO-like enzyme (type II secretory pathway)
MTAISVLLIGFVDHRTITWTCALYALQNATLVLLNASLLGCVGCLVFQLFGAASSQSWLAPHLAFLLFLAIGLWVSVNWCAPCQHAHSQRAMPHPVQTTPVMTPEL